MKQYLDLVARIIREGERRRTASGTIEGMGHTKEDKPKKGKKK